jgi:AbrB family looped-hinge helix DNA binding protein
MTVTLSSKGQLVIPKAIRRALALKPGAKFEVKFEQEQIIFQPLQASPSQPEGETILNQLYGCLADTDVLNLLEQEHRQEIERDHRYSL